MLGWVLWKSFAMVCLTILGTAQSEVEESQNRSELGTPAFGEDVYSVAMTCKQTIFQRWTGPNALDEIGTLVNMTLDAAKEDGSLYGENTTYADATRALVERQLASCVVSITRGDLLTAESPGGLSESDVDRLLGSTAIGTNLTEKQKEMVDNAMKNERRRDGESPAILGIQVHTVPWWGQILYMLGVVAAACYVVFLAIRKLTKKDKEKKEEKAKKDAKKKGS